MDKKIFEITCRFSDSITTIIWGQFVLWEKDGTIRGYGHYGTGKDSRQDVSILGVMAKADYNSLLPTDIAFMIFGDEIMWFRAAKTKDGLHGTYSHFQYEPTPSFTEGRGAVEITLKEHAYSNCSEDTILTIESSIFGRRLGVSTPKQKIVEAALDLYHETDEYIGIHKHNNSMQVTKDSP